jgi:hypothetical protein
MADPLAPDSQPHVAAPALAAALRDVAGVAVDPSTPEGELASAKIVSRLMADEATAQRLLAALEQHGARAFAAEAPLPTVYGAVAVARASAHASTEGEPPIGSADFEAYVSVQPQPELELVMAVHDLSGQTLVMPSALGFEDEPVIPISALLRQQIDEVLLAVQRKLEAESSFGKTSFLQRFKSAMSNEPLQWRTRCRVLAHNYLQLDAVRGSSRVHWASIAAGGVLYVSVTTDGKVMLNERLDLTDKAHAEDRLAEAFAAEPEAGAETLRELRNALVESAATQTRGATRV